MNSVSLQPDFQVALRDSFARLGPNSTNMGDIRRLYGQVQRLRPDVGLRLIHHSYATMTGADKATEMRLKYVELWFSTSLDDLWEVRESRGI